MPANGTIHGRDEHLAALRRAPGELPAGGALALLRGRRGTGRTTVLRAAEQTWRADGAAVLSVRPGAAGSIFGALREHLGDAARTTGGLVRTSLRVGAAIDRLAGGRPLVLIADDACAATDAATALDAVRRPGVLVVAACTGAGERLAAWADIVLDVPPLTTADRAAMLLDHYGAGPDATLDAALDAGLGPLAGCPAAVLDTCAELDRAGRLVTLDDRLCLARPDRPLPVTERTADLLGSPGDPVLADLAVNPVRPAELAVPAGLAGVATSVHGRRADRLAEAGVLTQDDEGRLRCSSPAVAAHLLRRLGSRAVAGRRRALAVAMLAARRNGAGIEPGALGDRIAGYRGAPDPGDEAMRLLLTLIARPDTGPGRRADWIRAAWERATDPRLRSRLAAGWLRELLRAGRLSDLGDAVETVLATGPAPEMAGDLAAAAMLAAVHTGIPVPDATRDRLLIDGRVPAALEFARRWFAGEPPEPGLVTAGARPAGEPGPRPESGLVTTAELGAIGRCEEAQTYPGDWASAFEAVLGERYHCPEGSLPAAYRRVLRGFTGGDFEAARTAAREVELTGSGVTPVHQLARVWAVEMGRMTGTGGERPDNGGPADPALVAWASCGPVELGAADLASVLTAYGKIASPSRRGRARLVPRLAQLAVRSGATETAQRLLDEVDDPEARLLTRAAVLGDPAAAAKAVALARDRDDRPALLTALMVAGSDHLVEAYGIARDLGAAPLQAWVASALRKHGLSVPAARSASDGFSPVEQRMLRMISAGRTNRQIGRRERLSEKTVEEHVSRLLARTGCRSRVQLATAVLAGRVGTGCA
ncbi:helix-turn-helix transcriptional regulator [Actinoplanes bogorensis]|uniref:Helix-turn-helix transcriptional regulator n=1 Tax=Paractinoplanes bogorensis TaxID=1610840 RepID=A0ABS5YM86_9ACTN|nr:helix-turn-helix transcriptional regulator [Actinoplanes bogorensis]MBU2663858.1 helix-turn-helix transcriptional regulator [Actinoplanes bogorensis]